MKIATYHDKWLFSVNLIIWLSVFGDLKSLWQRDQKILLVKRNEDNWFFPVVSEVCASYAKCFKKKTKPKQQQ